MSGSVPLSSVCWNQFMKTVLFVIASACVALGSLRARPKAQRANGAGSMKGVCPLFAALNALMKGSATSWI